MHEAVKQPEAKAEVVYRSVVRVEPGAGRVKLVYLPLESEPVPMGLHGAVAAHYKAIEGSFTPTATTLDYIVGATAGCLLGTLIRALQVRNIETGNGRLKAQAVGELEKEDGVLVIKRIRMQVHLQAEESQRVTAERVIDVYSSQCPVYRSLHKAIAITSELDFQPLSTA
jgi:uncharacterized OsmC-like protein